MSLLNKISQFFDAVQLELLPKAEEQIGPISNTHRRLICILEMIQIQRFIGEGAWHGRPAKDRAKLARAFVAKVVFQLCSTAQLIRFLKSDRELRLICGWEYVYQIPSE